MTVEEVQKMIEEATFPGLKSLIAFLYLYGVRVGEALRLEKKDFVIGSKSLKVHVPVEKKRVTGTLIFRHNLAVTLKAPFMSHITDALAQAPEGQIWPRSRKTYWRKIHRLNPTLSPHFFRKNRATKLAERTDNVFALVDWFGWADARPATRYVQMSGRLAARLSDKVD